MMRDEIMVFYLMFYKHICLKVNKCFFINEENYCIQESYSYC